MLSKDAVSFAQKAPFTVFSFFLCLFFVVVVIVVVFVLPCKPMKRNCVRTCMESSLFFSLTREMVGNNHHIFFFNRPLRVKKSRLFFFILIALIRVFKGTLHTTEARESVVCVVDGAH